MHARACTGSSTPSSLLVTAVSVVLILLLPVRHLLCRSPSQIVDYGGKLHRWRTDADGNLKFDAAGRPLAHDSVTPQQQVGEGCNVEGMLIVKQVPGNFHVSSDQTTDVRPTACGAASHRCAHLFSVGLSASLSLSPLLSAHAHGDLLSIFYPRFPQETLNCTHFVHNLVFGDTDVLRGIDEAAVSPLNGARKVAIARPEDQGAAHSYEYYIKVSRTTGGNFVFFFVLRSLSVRCRLVGMSSRRLVSAC